MSRASLEVRNNFVCNLPRAYLPLFAAAAANRPRHGETHYQVDDTGRGRGWKPTRGIVKDAYNTCNHHGHSVLPAQLGYTPIPVSFCDMHSSSTGSARIYRSHWQYPAASHPACAKAVPPLALQSSLTTLATDTPSLSMVM